MKKIDLSIIILSYNTKQITKDCLESIYASFNGSKITFEIIVVDNASTDESVAMLEAYKKNHNNLLVIANPENIGFGKANNQAVKQAKADCLLLLNSDTIILDSALAKMYNYYELNEKSVQFLGIRLLNKDKSTQPSAAPFFSLPIVFAFLFLKGDSWGLTRYSPKKSCYVDWVAGACIMCKKQYYEKINGFDEGIFMYMEEVDLLYRARISGMRTGFYSGTEIIHIGSASSNKTYPILQTFRGFLYFYKKHYGPYARFILRCMLKLKAVVALGIGKATGNTYLIDTYAQAYSLIDMV